MKSLEMLNLDRNHLMEIPNTVSGKGEGERRRGRRVEWREEGGGGRGGVGGGGRRE